VNRTAKNLFTFHRTFILKDVEHNAIYNYINTKQLLVIYLAIMVYRRKIYYSIYSKISFEKHLLLSRSSKLRDNLVMLT